MLYPIHALIYCLFNKRSDLRYSDICLESLKNTTNISVRAVDVGENLSQLLP